MHLVRTVRQSQRPRASEHPRERRVLAHAQPAVNLNRGVDDRERRLRGGDLTRGDRALRAFVPLRVQHPRSLERRQPRAVETDATRAQRLQRRAVRREGFTERDALRLRV